MLNERCYSNRLEVSPQLQTRGFGERGNWYGRVCSSNYLKVQIRSKKKLEKPFRNFEYLQKAFCMVFMGF